MSMLGLLYVRYSWKSGKGNVWKEEPMRILDEETPSQREHLTQTPYSRRKQACVFKELKKKVF